MILILILKYPDRLANEDVFSIVDTYFMPYGENGDLYSIMGEHPGGETKIKIPMTGVETAISDEAQCK